MFKKAVSTILIAFMCASAIALPPVLDDEKTIPAVSFRDLVIFNHFSFEKAKKRTIGIEVELAAISVQDAVAVLIGKLGGVYAGTSRNGTEEAHYIKGTKIGIIRLEPVNFNRLLNRWRETHPDARRNPVVTQIVEKVDQLFGQLEIVTEPLNYQQAGIFAKALDSLGPAGAKGTSNWGRLISVQPNIGIDSKDPILIKNILANYYRNKKNIRNDIRPAVLRYHFLGSIAPEFMEKLNDPHWRPTITELFDWYVRYSKKKLSRVQLFNALITNAENFTRFVQPKAGKQRPQRPVAEFREANTVMSDQKDPTKASRHVMREVDFALSLVEASEETGSLDEHAERRLLAEGLAERRAAPVEMDELPSLRSILDARYYHALKTRSVKDSATEFYNPQLASKYGMQGTPGEIGRQIESRHAIEVDNSRSPIGEQTNDPEAPFATAHNDGAGGVGDGRALILGEKEGDALSLKGSGLTPYQVKSYAMWLGLHTGGKDGKMSFKEGVRTWFKGEILSILGITSERVIALIDNKSIFVKGGKPAPSAEILRELPGGGIRNSHLNEWDAIQTRRGLEYLKGIATLQTGKKYTDTAYVAFDAAKTGELAARMQDFYIIHGALAKGNVLAYPGLVDISGISFLDVPDPEYASFAYLSRFGNQGNTLKRLLRERKNAYAKTNKNLLKMDESRIFDEAFARELSLLTLMRLGFERKTAESIYRGNPARALEYSRLVWKAQFGHLMTDVNKVEALIPSFHQRVQGAEMSIDAATGAILEEANAQKREFLKSRREVLAQFKNRLKNNYSTLSHKEAKTLVSLGLGFLDVRLRIPGEDIQQLAQNSRKRADLLTNLERDVNDLVSKAVQAKNEKSKVSESLGAIKDYLDQFSGRMSPGETSQERAVVGPFSCDDALKVVSGI